MDIPYKASFGREIRESLFLLDSKTAFANHSSYGTVPRPIFEKYLQLLRQVEVNPDKWFRLTYKSLYLNACEAVAEFIGASKGEVVLVENASTAVNVVLLSLNLGPKDCILSTTVCFKGCKIAIDVICKATGARSCYLNLKLPVTSKESVVRLFSDYLDQNPNVTFALVDHIPCACSVLFPVKEIVRVCHQKGVRVMIDGAPGPGQLRLDMKDIGADYYTGNLHKWMFSPRGCALLYVRNGLQDSVMPLTLPSSLSAPFCERFSQQDARDYTPMVLAPVLIDFHRSLGGLPAINAYNTALVSWATDMLCKRLHLHKLPVPPDMRPPHISMVSLPECLGPPTMEVAEELEGKLYRKHNVHTGIYPVDGHLWCRVSAQVYNVKEDYVRLAEALEKEINAAQTAVACSTPNTV